MANVKFTNPSGKDLSDKPVYVSDLAMAMGATFGEEVENEAGKMVPAAKFWTNDLVRDKDGNNFIEVADGTPAKNKQNAQVQFRDVGVLPCIQNAAENGLTTARLTNDPNDTREYLYDEKTKSFKMAPQSYVNEDLQFELTHLAYDIRYEIPAQISKLEEEYKSGRISQGNYETQMEALREKQNSLTEVESGFTALDVGENNTYYKDIETFVYKGETYARYYISDLNKNAHHIKEGAKFSTGRPIKKGIEYWFKYEPILAERNQNGDIQFRTVLTSMPFMPMRMREKFNESVRDVAVDENGHNTEPLTGNYLPGVYMNEVLAKNLGLTTDLMLEHEQKQAQEQQQANDREM